MPTIEQLWDRLVERVARLLVPYNLIIDKYSVLTRMSMCLSRGGLNRAALNIDTHVTRTWEYSVFSQNGEDGIVEALLSYAKDPNKYFVEIGSSDGLENNSSYLAFAKRYSGLMIEGDPAKSRHARTYLERFNWGVKYLSALVTRENILPLLGDEGVYSNPDFFSLDIDGIDYYVMEALLAGNYRPKIVCVEYNSTYGPTRAITVGYQADFNYQRAHASHFYYGVSIAGWRKLFARFHYDFVTVDSNGVNAFFVDRSQLSEAFPTSLVALEFVENFALRSRFRNTWAEQFQSISGMNYFEI